MALTRKPAQAAFYWADIVALLRRYFSELDPEYQSYFRIFTSSEPMRLKDVDAMCALGMPSPPVLTTADFVSGNYVEICWQYAIAQAVYECCEDLT